MPQQPDHRALFQTLVRQLQLPHDDLWPALSLIRVHIQESQRLWQFHVQAPQPLPVATYTLLTEALRATFATIAATELHVTTEASEPDPDLVRAYWPYVLHELVGRHTPAVVTALAQQPEWRQDHLHVRVENDFTLHHVHAQYVPLLQDAYRQVGCGAIAIRASVDSEAYAAQREAFLTRKQETDDALQSQAQQVLSQQKNAQDAAPTPDELVLKNNVVLGRDIAPSEPVIQMVTIQEESASVVLQGYIFAVDGKEIKNGRKAYTIKFTDYSGSFAVKLFAKTKKDIARYDAHLTTGKWIKVRGSIQEDPFLRDLAVVPRDIILVEMRPRLDTAVADKKRVELHLHTVMSQMDATNSISDYIAQTAR